MQTHADRTQENKSHPIAIGSVAAEVSKMESGSESAFQFVDNRPEAIAQRKLQGMANNSPKAKQVAQLQAMADNYSARQPSIQDKKNNTGLPDNLKSGIEKLSGYSMDDVNVHYNSNKPAQLQAHAYAQGTDIHLATGQEKHLPHEAWHVVQQKQGRVKPTMQMKGKVDINDDEGLEREADVMGTKSLQMKGDDREMNSSQLSDLRTNSSTPGTIQRSPDAFAGEAERLMGSGLEGGRFSNWGKLLSELDNYASLSPDNYGARNAKLSRLFELAAAWKSEYMSMGATDQQKVENQTKFSYLSRGVIAHLLSDEQRELRNLMGGSLDTRGQVLDPITPSLTRKKTDTYIERGKTVYSDRKLTKKLKNINVTEKRAELELNPAIVKCTILEDFKSVKHIEYYENITTTTSNPEPVYTNKVTGWVSAADITPSMETIVKDDSLDYENTDEPLFPKPPSKDDVIQGGLGDCYLLAALISIVSSNAGFFQTIMKDDGTNVTVKLFDVDHTSDPHTFTPKYVKVPKSKVVSKESRKKEAYAQASLWVQMLEKAFVAAGFTGVFGTPNDATNDVGGYAGIESGHMNVAFEYLLGKKSQVVDINTRGENTNRDLTGSGFYHFPWSDTERKEYDLAQKQTIEAYKLSAYYRLVSFRMLDRNIDYVDAWMKWLGGRDLVNEVKSFGQKGMKDYEPEIRLEDFVAYFKTQSLSQTIAGLVVEWLEEYKVFPGKRGTGKYTAEQEELFEDIRIALGEGKYLGLGSKEDISRGDPSAVGHSAGEPIAKGLVGRHAYSILDYGYGPDKTKDSESGKQRWVYVQNPWQQYGRKYDDKGKASDNTSFFDKKGAGGFWLELADLTKRYHSVYIGNIN